MDCGITTAAFHPDGVILGTGCQDTMVRVWEVRQQKVCTLMNGASVKPVIPAVAHLQAACASQRGRCIHELILRASVVAERGQVCRTCWSDHFDVLF